MMPTITDAPAAEPTPMPAYAPGDKDDPALDAICVGAAVAVDVFVELGDAVREVDALVDAGGGGKEKLPG